MTDLFKSRKQKDSTAPPGHQIASQRLLGLSKRLLAELDVDAVLGIAIDHAIEFSGAERGLIILFDQQGGALFETARKLRKEDIEHPEFEVSHTIINRVRSDGSPACFRNALEDAILRKSSSVARLKILSVICLPLSFEGKVFGVLYLDNRTLLGIFKAEVYAFMQEFAEFFSLAAHRALERKQLQNRVQLLETELRGKYRFESIVGHHPKMLEVLKLISQIADTDATVLIQGESGTGKELVAAALHYNSRRRDKSFVPINCAALPESLLESELFGHVRGAFTGAIKDKAGWFERANGGTVFLDEVSEMSPALQVKILRILQTGEYSRLGTSEIRYCSVRMIAASSRDLHTLVKQGKFREEVYYRLNVIDLWLPPLRDRRCDIPTLAQHFLTTYAAKHKKENLRISREAETLLSAYDFPGNVRELENVIQRAVVLTEGAAIEPRHLPSQFCREGTTSTRNGKPSSFREAKYRATEKFERAYIIDCLTNAQGNISRAAQIAGINVKNFHAKMSKYEIDPHAFKMSAK